MPRSKVITTGTPFFSMWTCRCGIWAEAPESPTSPRKVPALTWTPPLTQTSLAMSGKVALP